MYSMKFSTEKNLPFLRSAAQALQEENAHLRAKQRELRAVREEAAIAVREKAELEARLREAETVATQEKVALEARVRELEQERIQLLQEVQVLKEQLDRRVKALYGRKSERRPATETAEESETEPNKKLPHKRRKGHGPTPQPALPVEDVIDTLAGDALYCEHCGGTLEPLGHEAEEAELIAIEQRRIVLERHLRTKYHCPCCHTGVVTAPGPMKLVPGGRYALNFGVEVAYMKYLGHLPLERQVQMMRHEGLQVTTATLFDQIDALGTALTPTFLAIWEILQGETVLRADETPWAVLSNGHTENERFYAWCAVGSQYVAYRLLDTRSKDGAATILGAFAGTLMVDGLTSYPAAAKGEPGAAPKFKVANCMTHARRKFLECEPHVPAESKFALDLIGELYRIEREGKEPGANLGTLRNEKSRPLIDELFTWAKAQQVRSDLLPSSGLAKALGYLVNHEAGLRVFVDDPAVPIDNNESERAMRAPVLGRKNHYGSRSRRGTETAAILYTLVESAKRAGVPPKEYLEAAAEHALRKAGAVLLPNEFKRQLEAAREPPSDSA